MHLKLLPAALVLLLVAAAAPVEAHASQNSADGKVRVTWGWINEPAVTDAPNRLDLVLRTADTREPILDANGSITVELHHGEEELVVSKIVANAAKGNGSYTSEHLITPTAGGIYTLHITGTIAGSPIDLEIPATHAMAPIEDTYFPAKDAAPGDTSALEARIAALEAKVTALEAKADTQATTPATLSPQPTPASSAPMPFLGLGLVAMAAIAVALALRRRA